MSTFSSSQLSGKRIVVTGGAAFIGSFLVERLLEMGAEVRVPTRTGDHGFLEGKEGIEWIQGDLTDPQYCSILLEGADVLFHLASHRKNVSYHREHAQEIFDDNVGMTESLIQGIGERSDVCTVFVSTANAGNVDIDTKEIGGIFDGYIVSKAVCEKQWNNAASQKGFPLLIVRPVGIFGPRDYFGDDGNVIPALAVRASNAKDSLNVWGSGNQMRSFVYVEDLVEVLLRFIDANVTGVHPLSSPERISIGNLSQIIVNLVHPGLRIEFDTSKPEGVDSPELQMHACLNDMEWTGLEEGLEKAIAWWRERRK